MKRYSDTAIAQSKKRGLNPWVIVFAVFLLLPVLAVGRNFTRLTILGGAQKLGQNDAVIAYDIAYGWNERPPVSSLAPFPKGKEKPADPSPQPKVVTRAVIQPIVPILMYHHIGDPLASTPFNERYMFTSATAFRDEMSWLAKSGYHTITMPELFAGNLPTKPIVLTFDDGYQDNYDNAYKILSGMEQKGTFFVISGFANANYLSTTEIQEMSASGMDIESHTVDHQNLTTLSPVSLNDELVNSKQYLETILGKKVEFICYPFGIHNQAVIDATKAAGYRAAVMVKPWSPTGSMYELPRIEMRRKDYADSQGFKISSFINANSDNKWSYK